MTIDLIRAEVTRFLASSEPEVLCISGEWGVGKTYAWNQLLRTAQSTDRVRFSRYAYVSMFGQTSLEGVRKTIVEQTVDSKQVGLIPDISTFELFISATFRVWGLARHVLPFVPKASSYSDASSRLLYLAVRNQIICFDDLERTGSGLDILSILGLASELKEQKKCKVVILLNKDALPTEDAPVFEEQLEKVADIFLAFGPTASEAVGIAVSGLEPGALAIKEAVVLLGINNIRLIKKAERLVSLFGELVGTCDPRIARDSTRTIVLGCHAKYEPRKAPTIQFIRTYSLAADLMARDRNTIGEDAAYKATLRRLEFSVADDLDNALLDGVEAGAFDRDRIIGLVHQKQREYALMDQNAELKACWRMYHDSFDDNEDVLIPKFDLAIRNNMSIVSPDALNSVVTLFRGLGYESEASDLVGLYVASRSESYRFWNLSDHHLSEKADPAIAAAFSTRLVESTPPPDGMATLERIVDGGGWSREDILALSAVSADDFYQTFKEFHGEKLGNLIREALKFGQYANADPEMKIIAANASIALNRIASESPLNERRVGRFRIRLS